jgi:hypothetical protein
MIRERACPLARCARAFTRRAFAPRAGACSPLLEILFFLAGTTTTAYQIPGDPLHFYFFAYARRNSLLENRWGICDFQWFSVKSGWARRAQKSLVLGSSGPAGSEMITKIPISGAAGSEMLAFVDVFGGVKSGHGGRGGQNGLSVQKSPRFPLPARPEVKCWLLLMFLVGSSPVMAGAVARMV